ncbi:hypothetical protein CLOSTHATH_06685 [Hungatella hathewayi DSM 13479]|uniref:Uncharacterized protein n=1 Tax=Hungatella hathewayi DSM 13479 TaxID=566550 RepID=D3ASS8_9FIRM|nr:hypothetical protein CLOSTHATH_06685 [Hungatella hathewayi DSM 13479]
MLSLQCLLIDAVLTFGMRINGESVFMGLLYHKPVIQERR